MKRFFLLLVSAGLLAAEASAAWPGLSELFGSGSRRSSRSRQQSSAKRRQAAHAESENAKTNSAPSAVSGLSLIADETLPKAKPAPTVATNAAAQVATNTPAIAVANVTTQAVARVAAPKRNTRPPRISSNKVYYDRKEGYAVFTGKVHVDSEDYQLHANKAYVFFEGTNELKRIVAMGGVAMTNETKRAYGTKASYYRSTGMVVLYGDDKTAAEVRDESKEDDQVVKGSKIKFWTMSEQVEVVDARISAPVSGGMDGIKAGLTGQK